MITRRQQLLPSTVPADDPRRSVTLGGGTGKAHSQKQFGPQPVKSEPAVNWADYVRVEPGDYDAYCKNAHWYRDPDFDRWTCFFRFRVFGEGLLSPLGTIPMWLNGGDREKPQAGRRARYFREWVKANGGPPPRNDRLSPRVFAGRMARVRVSDTKGLAPYSVVREIVEWLTG